MNAAQKFIVWDWNGTLLDDTEAVQTAMNLSLNKMGCAPLTMERLRDIEFTSAKNFYRAAGASEEQWENYAPIERNMFHDSYEPLADHAPLRQGATDMLHRLKAHNVANFILSNHLVDQITRLLHAHNIFHAFDEVLAYLNRETQFRDMTKGERLRRYIATHGMNPAHAAIIGDTIEEIRIARELGMTSIAITGGVLAEHHLRAMNPDYVVHSFDDLHPVLREKGFLS